VDETRERVELWGLACDKVTIDAGSKSMHGPRAASGCKTETRRKHCRFASVPAGSRSCGRRKAGWD
jgi:hypothetical protein